MLLSYC
jgi:hypothetical protein